MITMEELKWKVKNWNGKLYKVFGPGMEPTHGRHYNWSLPGKDGKPGKWTKRIPRKEIEMCKRGWHLTTHYAHWMIEHGIVFEAESDSMVEFDGYDKVVCSRVRLIKRCAKVCGDRNSGSQNSGNYNSGNCNSGSQNSGNYNNGNCNSSDQNSGNCNSGYRNSGNRNSGDYNSGNRNSGSQNSGNCNSGYDNSGIYNSGDYNSGHYNSGNYNSGNRNSGHYNTCSGPHLILCTQPVKFLFNKPVDKWPSLPDWFAFRLIGTMAESWRAAFGKATAQEAMEAIALPNFDFDVFEEISGISKADFDKKMREIS